MRGLSLIFVGILDIITAVDHLVSPLVQSLPHQATNIESRPRGLLSSSLGFWASVLSMFLLFAALDCLGGRCHTLTKAALEMV